MCKALSSAALAAAASSTHTQPLPHSRPTSPQPACRGGTLPAPARCSWTFRTRGGAALTRPRKGGGGGSARRWAGGWEFSWEVLIAELDSCLKHGWAARLMHANTSRPARLHCSSVCRARRMCECSTVRSVRQLLLRRRQATGPQTMHMRQMAACASLMMPTSLRQQQPTLAAEAAAREGRVQAARRAVGGRGGSARRHGSGAATSFRRCRRQQAGRRVAAAAPAGRRRLARRRL